MQLNNKEIDKTAIFFVMNYWAAGGTEKVFEDVIRILEKKSDLVFYLFLINRSDNGKYVFPKNVTIIEGIHNLYRIKQKYKKIVAVNFSGYWKSGLVCYLLFHKYISWCHNNPYILRKARTGKLNFFLLKKSIRLVCICKEQLQIFREEFNFPDNMILIYNSVNVDKIDNLATEELNVHYDFFLMSARFELIQKDYITLINAYDLLDESYKEKYKLVLIGTGPDFEIVKDYIESKKLSNNVILPGFESNPYKWMKRATANILCSNYEGFSIVALESLAIDKPFIITDYKTGAREISGDGKYAYITPMKDSLSLNHAMLDVINGSYKSNNLGRQFIEEEFSYEMFEKRINNLFSELVV